MGTGVFQFQILGHQSNAARAYKQKPRGHEIQVSGILCGSKITSKIKKDEEKDDISGTVT